MLYTRLEIDNCIEDSMCVIMFVDGHCRPQFQTLFLTPYWFKIIWGGTASKMHFTRVTMQPAPQIDSKTSHTIIPV